MLELPLQTVRQLLPEDQPSSQRRPAGAHRPEMVERTREAWKMATKEGARQRPSTDKGRLKVDLNLLVIRGKPRLCPVFQGGTTTEVMRVWRRVLCHWVLAPLLSFPFCFFPQGSIWGVIGECSSSGNTLAAAPLWMHGVT